MDSRIHLGQGFSISQQEKDDFQVIDQWIPVTPHRPIPVRPKSVPVRSNLMPINQIGNQFDTGNWQEQFQFPVEYMPEMLNYNSVAQHFGQINRFGRNVSFADSSMMNQISGPYTELLLNESFPSNQLISDFGMMNNTTPTVYPIPNRTLNGIRSMEERSTVPNLNTPVDSSGMFFADQAHCSSSNLLGGYSDLFQPPQDEFPVPYNNSYNLNSSPSTEADAASTVTNAPSIEQAKRLEKELSELINFPQGNSSTKATDKRDPSVVSVDNVSNPLNTNEHLQNIVDLTSAVISTPFEDPKDLCQENEQVIDLNKTPEQKTPKRRKHRPKVVVEGKPKRTPKVAGAKENTKEKRKYVRKTNLQESATQNPDSIRETPDSGKKQKVKRKYVRKKSMNAETQNTDCISETTDPSAKTAGSSCRRALNFEMGNACSERERDSVIEQEILQKREEIFNLNAGFQVAESSNQSNMMSKALSDLPARQHNGTLLVAQQSEVRNLASFMDQLSNNQSWSERRPDLQQSSSRKDGRMDHLKSSGRDIDIRMLQHDQAEGIGRILFPAQTNFRRLENNKRTISPVSESFTKILESAETKGYRSHHELTSDGTGNPLDGSFCMKSQVSGAVQSENHKKQKVEHGSQRNINPMSAPTAAVNQSTGKGNSYSLDSSASSVQGNRQLFKSYFKGQFHSCVVDRNLMTSQEELLMQQKWAETSSGTEKSVVTYNIIPPTPPKIIPQPGERRQTQNCYIDASEGQAMALTRNYNLTPPKIAPQPGERQSQNYNINGSKGQAVALTPFLSVSSRKGKIPEKDMDFLKDQQSLAKRKAGRPAKQKSPITIEEIIYKMEQLSLNQSINETALVPYKGDGVLIPYKGLDFIKKRKPRPKVDLDPETERVWRLLMWKEEGENLEDSDKNKQRWEEERRVFRGRADSFIARMHLVQGDRRFSKWKGSVVDSVIGVFLTQNVSDHLSSSAFMHLVAKYPSRSMRERNCEEGPTILIQEPDTCVMNQNQPIWPERLLGPLHNQSFKVPHKLKAHQRHETLWTERSIVESRSQSPQEEILSSQDSVDSSVVQRNRRVGSNSGSNSEAEDPANGCKHNHQGTSRNLAQMNSNTSFEDLLGYVCRGSAFHEESRHFHWQPETIKDRQQLLGLNLNVSSTSYQENNSNNPQLHTQATPSGNSQLYISPELGVLGAASSQLYREESTSHRPASASKIINVKDANCTSNRVLQGAESTNPRPQKCGSKQYQESSRPGQDVSLNKQLLCEETCHGSQLHEMNQSFQLDCESISKPQNLSDGRGGRQEASNIPKLAAKLLDVEDRTASVNEEGTDLKKNFIESNSKDAVNSGSKANSNANSSKARKEKTGNGKKDAVDWEGLRRSVLANDKRKERSADAMDSLDYEAMRNASVDEISNIIKERGMNNMLAGRIKEFLERLVREHGSTDLEWLRDVPPQKAKDYLLSIRGLGLKSVECVRLLTLHHVAFPVDTNVGRIAVRLGWVPLQPLPESLQLHLLELYPILESIQKYLWPRLCELDQRTLYELHYQLITFGKVFCTKSRPNCNACPLRAECRHFASAFTSARLALPGPEEKSIVTANVPLTTERSPGIVIDPLPLPPAEENSAEKRGLDIVSCAPIIEEPATPEQQHSEVTESEIEDIFDEDDEIPTIKLNMKELTVNLQNYLQDNMELQECDMSKALVALNPEAASIPAPKLKNVSRLRTEHQVYELPDSHPLLEGMDKREADDPSPYLLAIWTPGETANSVQPPEENCQFQGSGNLCDEKTCFSCNSIRETNSQTVRGTLLIPCRTAMRGSFPLNGTYFQVNEMFADHESSLNPIDVPRSWIWNLPRRTVYFGTSVTAIFRGLSTEGIQYCFWKGFVCVRGFEQKTRAPRPLIARLHFPASKLTRTKDETQKADHWNSDNLQQKF